MIINVDILRRPANWLTVWTMFILTGFVLHLVLTGVHGKSSSNALIDAQAGDAQTGRA